DFLRHQLASAVPYNAIAAGTSSPSAAVMLPTGSMTSKTSANPATTLHGMAIHHGTPGLMMRASRGRLMAALPGHGAFDALPLYVSLAGLAKGISAREIATQHACPASLTRCRVYERIRGPEKRDQAAANDLTIQRDQAVANDVMIQR